MFQRIKLWWHRRKLRSRGANIAFAEYRVGTPIGISDATFTTMEEPPEDLRESVKPVDVIHLLEDQSDINLDDLEFKLEALQSRAEFHQEVLERSIPPNIKHAIKVIEARMKYPKMKESYPWRTTTKDKINKLTKKYKLDHKSISEFLPEFPEDVIVVMEDYKRVHDKLWKKKDRMAIDFSIIAPPHLFKTRRGDPILLAKSPFGDFYYVLCAWDKEVEFVKDLLV